MFGLFRTKDPDPLAGVPDFRRKSMQLLVDLPPDTYLPIKSACDALAAYRQHKKPRPGSIDQVVYDRRHAEAVALVRAAGIDQDQAADIVHMLVDGST